MENEADRTSFLAFARHNVVIAARRNGSIALPPAPLSVPQAQSTITATPHLHPTQNTNTQTGSAAPLQESPTRVSLGLRLQAIPSALRKLFQGRTTQNTPPPPTQSKTLESLLREGNGSGEVGIRTRCVALFMDSEAERIGITFCRSEGLDWLVVSPGLALLIKGSTQKTSLKRKKIDALAQKQDDDSTYRLVRLHNKAIALFEWGEESAFAQASSWLQRQSELPGATPGRISVDSMRVGYDKGDVADRYGCLMASKIHEVIVYEDRGEDLGYLKDQIRTPSPLKGRLLKRLCSVDRSDYRQRWRPKERSSSRVPPGMSGFHPGHSTTTALVKITEDIRSNMDNQRVTVLTLLDFSNTFNTVDFELLSDILCTLNISPEVTDWLHNYLQGRRQRVRVNYSFSNWIMVSAGVPQAISRINVDLSAVANWTKSFGLTMNPAKLQSIIIGSFKLISRINKSQLPPIVFDGIVIPYSEKVTNLGIIIDQNHSWVPQMNELSRKVFSAVGSLRRLRNFLPTSTKIALAHSLLLPILDYADSCYLDVTEEQLNKLERIQNLCIRFIFDLGKYDHISYFRIKLKWLPIRLRRNTHILNLLYSILFNPMAPSYLRERFKYLNDSHERELRSNDNLLLEIPSHSTTFYTKSFTVRAARLWNSLPLSIRLSQTPFSFKKSVKQHFLQM
ncbi:unnamed protein product [Euphydryas editha]|uniref:Reverse transcriptase domain-containing protein n=1 Tax=Euphydryas editha TaxID=104508 RepID=A0AAU9UAJ6_EUPED|nr:unnamed protein product [Euphydryas editha]